MRKIIAALGALALMAVVVPQQAHAAEGGVVVFSGNATVGSGAYNGAGGNGLCFPNLDPANACQLSPGVAVPTNGWEFTVPATDGPVVICSATGTFGGITAAGEPCIIDSDGDVAANAAGVGPSCGMSAGTSKTSHGDDDDPLNGEGPDVLVLPGPGVSGPIETNWITSAGGTIPLTGSYDLGTGSNDYVGLVQARPLDQGACASAPAQKFFVIGVTAGAAA